jgi:hypothetical protein
MLGMRKNEIKRARSTIWRNTMIELLKKTKAVVDKVICHRVCDGMAALAYGAVALEWLGKGEASAVLCVLYLALALRG